VSPLYYKPSVNGHLLNDVVVSRRDAREEGAQRGALCGGRVEWLGGSLEEGDEWRGARREEVVEDIGNLDQIVLALGHLRRERERERVDP